MPFLGLGLLPLYIILIFQPYCFCFVGLVLCFCVFVVLFQFETVCCAATGYFTANSAH